MKKTVAIIQARMGSTRLPGKTMKDLFGRTVLAHVIERIKQVKNIDEIVVATTVSETDDIIEVESLKCGVKVFRGSEEDVLSRYFYTAIENEADIIVRITSDCPLIDPKIIDLIIEIFKDGDFDIVTNAGINLSSRTYPRGFDTEVFSYNALKEANKNAKKSYQREHVTPYIYENVKNIFYYKNNKDYSKFRLTLDTEQDWQLIHKLYEHLYFGNHDFYLKEIISVMEENPSFFDINKDIKQKILKTT